MKKFLLTAAVLALSLAIVLAGRLKADNDDPGSYNFGGQFHGFQPGNLVLSRSVYVNNPNFVKVGEVLPPGCATTSVGCTPPDTATFDGTYPYVFNNDAVDGSFGVTSPLFLDQLTPFGWRIDTLPVPTDQLVTSFSSKSEGALNLSTDKKYLTFIDYVAQVGAVDASNANTPGVVDATNPVGETFYRAVAKVDQHGHFDFTETNAYSGNNGRAAIYNKDADVYYAVGNAGNGSNPQPAGILLAAGMQIMTPANKPESKQNPGTPTPVASFNITEIPPNKADKLGKDDNFRGLRIFNNVIYATKGSGGNGIDTVYFVDTTGTACPNGVGVPVAGATLPTAPLTVPPTSTLLSTGLPNNMCVLSGFNTVLAKTSTQPFPFGLWFANANTLYVADEGDGNIGKNASCPASPAVCDPFLDAKSQTTAGLQKWTFNGTTWTYQYTLQAGLELGVPYTIPGYPTGNNAATANKVFTTGLPWTPATDGLRNIAGRVNWDGTATIWAITSTVSGNGDQGADPNRLVMITDNLSATGPNPPPDESFTTLRTAQFAEVFRGISFTPGTGADDDGHGH
jgi:hypothetical protein